MDELEIWTILYTSPNRHPPWMFFQTFFFKSSLPINGYWLVRYSSTLPQPAATPFAFPSVWLLFSSLAVPGTVVEDDKPLLPLPLGHQQQVGQQEQSQLLLRHPPAQFKQFFTVNSQQKKNNTGTVPQDFPLPIHKIFDFGW